MKKNTNEFVFIDMVSVTSGDHFTWDSGERNEKLIQHQNRNWLQGIFEFVFTQMT